MRKNVLTRDDIIAKEIEYAIETGKYAQGSQSGAWGCVFLEEGPADTLIGGHVVQAVRAACLGAWEAAR